MSAGDPDQRTPDTPVDEVPQAEAACAEEAPPRVGVCVSHCVGIVS